MYKVVARLGTLLVASRYFALWRRKTVAYKQNRMLRNKFLKFGAHALSNAELLALFSGANNSLRETEYKMEALLERCGGLRMLLNMSMNQMHQHGLKEDDIVRFKVFPELARRQLLEEIQRGPALLSAPAVRRYVRQCMRDYKREVFMCIFLNARHQVIEAEEIFIGSINGAHVYPREVMRKCLEHNAVSVILVHNHPSGKPEPSASDERITSRINSALAILDISVVDHLVVGENEVVSFSQRGLL
jgi:DNA repair protein RadC